MKKVLLLVLLSFLVFGTAFSRDKVIYGSDDRLDYYDVSNLLYLLLSESTAAMINRSQIENMGEDYRLNGSRQFFCVNS